MSQADISSAYTFQIQSTIDQLEHQLLTIKDESNKLAILIQKTRDASLLTEKELSEIKANMDMLSVYNNKLLSIKATMSMLSGRSKQLLSRAEKLKQIKMEYLLQIDEIKRIEQQKDQSIAAAVVQNKPTIPKTVKKKKKARQVLLEEEHSSDWKPKRKEK
ncbi:uncharacterized protein RHIMIDRAFT_257695 [Rhizopus microsporus ATCC 52813]|uniref:Biogenesis of lysosome-related organelles complex 1 subunit 6 n=1 Tax=Rhizopus microsporus ATCC 52813 TaxID=1340429 RepID=A0A2G4SRS4_RHIZD|nr:uncharacterized protein RHIMIDRAFT_257695 [Rhizopus microsporus ATCC 52813]PHZ11461.1 hypothetical protein RHIMIDRAFT_257695 [Rhizopus microsporus ATCC 52813]